MYIQEREYQMNRPSKRRQETALRIQAAAIRLALQDGMANLTTEAIAREAGVSPRTFFNYYPYKEAAIAGPPKDYPREALEAFVDGKGALAEDLAVLMRAHLTRFVDQRDQIAASIELAKSDPKLAAIQQTALMERHSVMEQMLHRRLDDEDSRLAAILAAAIVSATRHAALDWATGGTEDLVGRALENINLIVTAGNLLADGKKR